MKLSAFKSSATKRILVYGAPKTGKTVLVGKLAEAGFKLKWLDLENGAGSLLTNVKPEFHDNIELIQIPDTKAMPIAAETVLKVVSGSKCIICETHGKVNCPVCKSTGSEICTATMQHDEILVIDSATQLTNSIMSHIARNKPDDYKPDWDDWRMQGALLDKIFSMIQQANYNVIIISHESLVEMEDKKMKIVPVAGSSNFSKTFAKYFDEVIYCEMVNKGHRFGSSTGYAMNVLSGSRSNIVTEKMAEPSLVPFFENLMKEREAKK